jgi:hypothetical protein
MTVALSLISAGYCVVMWGLFHRQYPYDWPFYRPSARFSDFFIYEQKFRFFHQASFFSTGFPFTYPAPMALLYKLFFILGDTADLCAFLAFLSLAFVVPAVLFGRALAKRGLSGKTAATMAGITLLLSWPALLMFDRANVEVFVWLALAVGTWAYARKKEWTAAAMFGVAASLKLFPFVYLALFFTRRGYKKLLFGVLTFLVVTIGSLAILGPTVPVAYRGISAGLLYFDKEYMETVRPDETGVDHSLLAFGKVINDAVSGSNETEALQRMVKVYLPLTAICGLLLYFLKIRRLPWINQLLVLTIVAIYFTPFSGDGTLIHLYYPFVACCFLAIDAWRRKVEIRGMRVMFWCFAYLLSTESFFVFYGQRYEGQAKCFVLGILLVCALMYPLVLTEKSLERKGRGGRAQSFAE